MKINIGIVTLNTDWWNTKNFIWSRPGSNRGPSACKADVITTTPQDQASGPKGWNLSTTKVNVIQITPPIFHLTSIAPSIAQLVERWTVVVQSQKSIGRWFKSGSKEFFSFNYNVLWPKLKILATHRMVWRQQPGKSKFSSINSCKLDPSLRPG